MILEFLSSLVGRKTPTVFRDIKKIIYGGDLNPTKKTNPKTGEVYFDYNDCSPKTTFEGLPQNIQDIIIDDFTFAASYTPSKVEEIIYVGDLPIPPQKINTKTGEIYYDWSVIK